VVSHADEGSPASSGPKPEPRVERPGRNREPAVSRTRETCRLSTPDYAAGGKATVLEPRSQHRRAERPDRPIWPARWGRFGSASAAGRDSMPPATAGSSTRVTAEHRGDASVHVARVGRGDTEPCQRIARSRHRPIRRSAFGLLWVLILVLRRPGHRRWMARLVKVARPFRRGLTDPLCRCPAGRGRKANHRQADRPGEPSGRLPQPVSLLAPIRRPHSRLLLAAPYTPRRGGERHEAFRFRSGRGHTLVTPHGKPLHGASTSRPALRVTKRRS
jgi:hypothetical protein